MVFIFSPRRRRRLAEAAQEARAHVPGLRSALFVVLIYNLVGAVDIYSTWLALSRGVGEEANPLLRAMMDNFGPGWIAGKLVVQALVSAMVVWFPHPIVSGLFAVAVTGNALVVVNNLAIAFGLI